MGRQVSAMFQECASLFVCDPVFVAEGHIGGREPTPLARSRLHRRWPHRSGALTTPLTRDRS
jgi:hypothetical protein